MLSSGNEQIQGTNWSGNLTYGTNRISYPQTVEELQEVVQQARKIRGLGSRHSFNTIADSTDQLVAMNRFNRIIALDPEAKTVTVEGGVTYGQLSTYLHQKGFALHNLASLPHISIAGACATATHGSGLRNGNLATAVVGLELIDANGQLKTLNPLTQGADFEGAVVGLGSLGLVTRLTLRIEATYQMQQAVYLNLPLRALATDFNAIMASGYSVSFFTDWQHERLTQVWIKQKTSGSTSVALTPSFYGATLATENKHPLPGFSAENCTEQGEIPGHWYERLPHFRMGFTPSSGEELQSEYFVPLDHAHAAIRAVAALAPRLTPQLFVSEIRTIAADTLWMSPHYEQPSVALHFTWKPNWGAVQKLLPLLESQLAPFNARPHWGKLFTMAPAVLRSRLPRLADFKSLLVEYDPAGKFRNPFIESVLFSR